MFQGANKKDLDRHRLAYREEESYLNPSTEDSRVDYEQVESFIDNNAADESAIHVTSKRKRGAAVELEGT